MTTMTTATVRRDYKSPIRVANNLDKFKTKSSIPYSPMKASSGGTKRTRSRSRSRSPARDMNSIKTVTITPDPMPSYPSTAKFWGSHKTIGGAASLLKKHVDNLFKGGMKADQMAAVFDIDGTVLKSDGDDEPHAIKGMCDVLHSLRARGIAVFFVTARPESHGDTANRKWTIEQLTKVGCWKPGSALVMMPAHEVSAPNFSKYKAYARASVEKDFGKTVVFNAGDNWADLGCVPPYQTKSFYAITSQVLNIFARKDRSKAGTSSMTPSFGVHPLSTRNDKSGPSEQATLPELSS
mgnify:CR=1 FL=1